MDDRPQTMDHRPRPPDRTIRKADKKFAVVRAWTTGHILLRFKVVPKFKEPAKQLLSWFGRPLSLVRRLFLSSRFNEQHASTRSGSSVQEVYGKQKQPGGADV